MVTEYIYIPVQIPHNFYTNIYSGLCDIFPIITPPSHIIFFPRLNNYGSLHIIHKHHTYLHEIQISIKTEIPKQNSLLISQYLKLHI